MNSEILFRNTLEEIKRQYRKDNRPWVVGFSGGKDSSVVMQLVFNALLELERTGTERCHKPVYILSSDTLVEPPIIKDYLESSIKNVDEACSKSHLPIFTKMVKPNSSDTFFINLIGRGYPSPNRWFRWCTDRLKIRPSTEFIASIVKEHGSVILLLGTRYSESSQRSASMKARKNNSRGLNPHSTLPSTLVYTPIANWSNDDVWEYLLSMTYPWEDNNRFLLELYKQANSGECPLVVDQETASCGNSRFGCWVCTVVTIDKSMRGFVDSGEEWMSPLLEFRNWLAELRDNKEARMKRRRNGSSGSGPFTSNTRQEILKRLLDIEETIKIPLITDEELWHIQRIWAEEWDIFFTALEIAQNHGRLNSMEKNNIFSDAELKSLKKICNEEAIELELVRSLLNIENDYRFHNKKHGIKDKLKKTLEMMIY